MLTVDEITRRIDAHMAQYRQELDELVAIPSVSGLKEHEPDMVRDAEKITEFLALRGLDAQIIQITTDDGRVGRPAVMASRPAEPGKPTVLLYSHHDVQPTGDLAQWDTDPFTTVEKNGRLYGRGAADDKAGILVHLAALAALSDETGVGIRIFFEGEEESGSPTFKDFIEQYKDQLAADVIVVADSSNWRVGTPSLTTSLRGNALVTVRVRTLDHAIHSGMFGGPVADSMTETIRLLSTLWAPDGSLAVEGLNAYDETDIEYPEDDLRSDAGVLGSMRLLGHGSLASRLWTQPSLTVTGIDAPDVEHASNTLWPETQVMLSLRVTPGQDPHEAAHALIRHLQTHAPDGAQVDAQLVEAGPAYQAHMNSDVVQIAHWALKTGFGHDYVDMGVGGSIPFIADFQRMFPSAEVVVTGIEDPDTRAHSQNESLSLSDWRSAMIAEALFIARLGSAVEVD